MAAMHADYNAAFCKWIRGRPGSIQSFWDSIDPEDPRLFFRSAGGPSLPPELVTLTSFTEAIWVVRSFPGVPMVVLMGPPLLLQAAEDIEEGHASAVADFWSGFQEVMDCARRGRCLLAAESLFRCEQFFYQTGVDVPFLRPMSVWVNATYCRFAPRRRGGDPNAGVQG